LDVGDELHDGTFQTVYDYYLFYVFLQLLAAFLAIEAVPALFKKCLWQVPLP